MFNVTSAQSDGSFLRRQRHPRVTVISAEDATPAGACYRVSSAGNQEEFFAPYLGTVKHMLQCVFPVPADDTAEPTFESLLQPRTQPFEGYSPEPVLRSVRLLVEYFAPSQLESEESGKRVLSELLKEHLGTYTRCVTAALKRELDTVAVRGSAATRPAVNEEEEEEQDARWDAHADVVDEAAAAQAQLAFEKLVRLWCHFRAGVGEIANLWVYLGPQSTVECSVQYLESALAEYPSVVDHALSGFSAVLTKQLHAGGVPTTTTTSSSSCADRADHSHADTANKKALHDFTQLFLAINQYVTRVQPMAVLAVRTFYEQEAKRRWADEQSVVDYYRWIEASWAVERARCQDYLHPDTAPLLEAAIDERVLDTDITREIIDRDFGDLLESHAYEAMQLLLRVARRSGVVEAASVAALTRALRAYIERTGKHMMKYLNPAEVERAEASSSSSAAVKSPEEVALATPFGVVCGVLALMQRCEDAVRYGFFKSTKEFSAPLHEGLQSVLSTHAQAFSDQLAQYVDFVMKEIEDGVYPLRLPKDGATSSTTTGAAGGGASADSVHPTETASSTTAAAAAGRSPPPVRRSRSPLPAPSSDERERKRAALEVEARPAMAMEPRPTCGEVVLASISRLFSYHPSKDYFEAFYWRGLCYRLLHPYRTPNLEAEECFILLLKAICGSSVTAKFEGMLLDVRASHDTDALYAEWVMSGGTSITKPKPINANRNTESSGDGGAEASAPPALTGPLVPPPATLQLHCHFFTNGYWPAAPFTIQLPPVLARQVAQLDGFYQASFNNRRLQWRHGLATAEVRARYVDTGSRASSADGGGRTYQLMGTFAQALILMHMDEHQPRTASSSGAAPAKGVSVQDLCESLGMDRAHFETRDALHGLCHPRCRLLIRASAEAGSDAAAPPPLAPTDVLTINDDFTSSTVKVRIPCFSRLRPNPRRGGAAGAAGSGDHTDEEAARVANKVVGERSFMVEVAIVRFMKAHRTCSHAELMEGAPTSLRFPVTAASMKASIEKLIGRGFLARTDAGGYEFVA